MSPPHEYLLQVLSYPCLVIVRILRLPLLRHSYIIIFQLPLCSYSGVQSIVRRRESSGPTIPFQYLAQPWCTVEFSMPNEGHPDSYLHKQSLEDIPLYEYITINQHHHSGIYNMIVVDPRLASTLSWISSLRYSASQKPQHRGCDA